MVDHAQGSSEWAAGQDLIVHILQGSLTDDSVMHSLAGLSGSSLREVAWISLEITVF